MDPSPVPIICVAAIVLLYYVVWPLLKKRLHKPKAEPIEETDPYVLLNQLRKRRIEERRIALHDFDNQMRAIENLPQIPLPTEADLMNATIERMLKQYGARRNVQGQQKDIK